MPNKITQLSKKYYQNNFIVNSSYLRLNGNETTVNLFPSEQLKNVVPTQDTEGDLIGYSKESLNFGYLEMDLLNSHSSSNNYLLLTISRKYV
jgi:hypothetical protein